MNKPHYTHNLESESIPNKENYPKPLPKSTKNDFTSSPTLKTHFSPVPIKPQHYKEGYSQPQPACFDKEFYCLSAVL